MNGCRDRHTQKKTRTYKRVGMYFVNGDEQQKKGDHEFIKLIEALSAAQ